MKIRINKRITLLLLLVFICIISIPSALSMYREKQTKTLKTTITHPNYTVTADANGGSIPATTGWTGTGNTATKSVTYNSSYGTLPEPTRTGYTFKGWNGKNKFSGLVKGVRIYDTTGVETTGTPCATTKFIDVDFSQNNYYLSGLTNTLYSFVAVYDENKNYLGRTSGMTRTNILLNSSSIQEYRSFDVSSAKYIRITQYENPYATGTINDVDNLQVQLEEGTTETPYEPYYVTSSTQVTQAKDHTVKAIWDPVNYEIQYDLQGGTVSTANQASYNIETATFTLNNPTQPGYTFTGWTGSNGNTPETTVTIPVGSTGDRAYIANWQANTYDVTFDTNGGTIGANELFSFDGSTHTIDGTINGATWGTDYLQFAGNSSSYVRLGQINSDYMTLQATFSIDEPVDGIKVIIGNIESGGGSIHIESHSGQYVILGQLYINGEWRKIYSDIVPEVDKKYNVLLSYDGETERLFIDNVLIGETKINGTIGLPENDTIMALGGNPTGNAVTQHFFKGKIYNASIYSNPKKQVTYDSPYGTLPTPTRDGYIFKGWNGKNLLDITKSSINNFDTASGQKLWATRVFGNNWVMDTFDPSKQYTISYSVRGIEVPEYDTKNSSNLGFIIYSYKGYNARWISTSYYIAENETKKITQTFYPPTDIDNINAEYQILGYTNRYLKDNNGVNSKVAFSQIQLEEGSTATTYEPYYVISSTNVTQAKNHTLKAIWEKKETTFLPGSEFNAKIKQLAGNQNATYETEDLNITSIVRSNNLTIMPTDDNVMSTSDSEYPIYAWFDSNNGTIYYYTEALNPYMNSNSGNMFRNLKNLTSLDLSEFDTKYTTYMDAMFYNCLKLSSLNISNFDTSNVINMGYMFGNCKKLVTLDLSNFDMSRVTSVEGMFNNFGNPSELQTLKTPKVYPTDGNIKITLPKTMIDASGNEYTEINNTNQTEIMLYTPATFIDGWKFNLRIKQLAGNQIQTYGVDDNNIRRIVRSNNLTIMPIDENVVSTTDSYTPIYVWFDSNDGTIYYYTEALNPYMNANAHSMFRQLVKVTSIDLGTINTSKATHMAAMFYASSSLTNLDLSTFDMSGITSSDKVASIFGTLTSLTSLKTPKVYPTDSSVKITLPKLMIDSNGNEYTELNSSSPTETMLYTPATFLPGGEFNIKIKQLAGNSSPTTATADTNITNIVRTNTLSITPTNDNIVSTSDSNTPIYAWFDNGIIYYYSEAADLYLNSNANYMFMNLRGLTSLDIDTINTNKTTQMAYTFYNLVSLQSLNLSNFDTSNVSLMQGLFYGCNSLTSLDISTFDMDSVTNTNSMIGSMASLESLKTPKVYPTDSRKITLPKLMIDSNGNEYTELNSSSPTETMLYTPATFLPGQEFNAKIKQLAGNTNATYNTFDTNITNILRANSLPSGFTPTSDNIVSMNDSYIPIYAWYDNGTLYYYSESSKLYMNSYAYAMFQGLRNVLNIDLTGINTTQVTEMTGMFTFDTHLISLDLSNFDTSKVRQMQSMFHSCASLQELDLSSFNMTKVTNTSYLFYSTSSLESLKTPKVYPSEAVIQMPKTLYDSSGNGWSVLDSSAPTETWLHKMVCKRATTLHTETCSQTSDSLYCSGAGYTVGGSKNTSTITYGSLGTNSTTLNSGDAFTCDVNGDGTFNETNERFYYVGDYYNTTTKEFETDTGVLIYYNNVSAGAPNNTTTSAYDSSGENWHGPVTAISQLPTTSQWSNVSLKNNTRAILSQGSTNTTPGGTLPSDFSYSGYSARLLTLQEINNSLNRTLSNVQYRLDDIAPYYFENTLYSSSSLQMRFWLETPAINDISALTIMTTPATAYVNGIYPGPVNSSNYGYGVRPAIEVNKNFLNKKVNAYLITYDTNGGSENTTQTVIVGDSLGSLSVPTKEGYTFNGWFTDPTSGAQVTSSTVPTGSTTYYAHWTAHTYTVTFNGDGSTSGTMSDESFTYGQSKALTQNAFTRSYTVTYDGNTGTAARASDTSTYQFSNWGNQDILGYDIDLSDSKSGISSTGVTYGNYNGYGVVTGTKNTSGGYIDFAKWSINSTIKSNEKYRVTFYAKGTNGVVTYLTGVDGSAIQKVERSNGSPATGQGYIDTTVTSSWAKYTITWTLGTTEDITNAKLLFRVFNGSSVSIYGVRFEKLENGEYDDQEVVSNLSPDVNGTVTLYASWEPQAVTLPNATKAGYVLDGWYDAQTNGNKVGEAGDSYIPESNQTLYAYWTQIYEPETRIRSLNTIGTSIADDDPDSNLRYIGSNPNNYVSFNGQKWRIIGVFDGKLKIIQESIGSYSWDTSRNTVNKGYGVNKWGPSGTYTGADLMKLLNPGYSSNTDLKCNSTYSDGNCGTNDDSDYTSDLVNNSLWWNAGSGYCYNNANYKTTACDFTTTGLQSNTARNMIDNVTWYLGTPPSSDNIYDGRMTASYLYNMERSNNNGSTTWQGKVGLLYPSDYVYATGGGTTYNRNTCLTVHVGYVANSSISNWDNTYTDCKNNDWLFTSNWTHSISARPIATNNRVFSIYTSGFITDYYASYSQNVRPVVYLKSSIKFTTGDGSFNSPFNLIDTE